MATSSRPFQSQTVARLLTGWRQITHGGGRWLRQGRTAAVWALQVAVYPLYAAAQGLRLGYRQLRATRPWQPIWAKLAGTRPPDLVEADIPLRALLSVLQPPAIHGQLSRPIGVQLVKAYGQWLRQSKAGAVLTPGQWHLVPLHAPIRGLASDLASRRLVLVTVGNKVFADLTTDQHERLHQAIVLMLAEYGRLSHRQAIAHHLQQPGLPVPKANPALLPPFRWIPPLLRWMQISPLAAATNLFGEAEQQQAIGAIALHRRATQGDRLGLRQPPIRPETAGSPRVFSPFSSQLSGSISLAQLPPTISVEQVVDLVVATPGAVAVAERSPSDLMAPREADALIVETSPVPLTDKTASMATADPISSAAPTPASLPPADTLEAQVVQVSYVDAPLAMVLRGLDWVLYAIETRLREIWAWLQRHW